MNDLARGQLCRILAKYGRGICDEPKRLRALLADLCPALKLEVNLLASAVEHRVVTELLHMSANVPWQAVSGRLTRRMADDLGVNEDLARWTINTWSMALGLIPSAPLPGQATSPQQTVQAPVASPASARPRSYPSPKLPPNLTLHKESSRRWLTFALVFIGGACALGLTGLWWLWPSKPKADAQVLQDTKLTADAELLQDWDDSNRVYLTTGSSLPFYRDRAPKRIQAWKRFAEGKNPMGMYMYGRCLHEGFGVEKDESEAYKWYRRAADLGIPRAINIVGYCYDTGTGVAKDPAEAIKWYRRAADSGESVAMTNLGYCYQSGSGVPKNEKEAVTWFRQAAELGNSKGMTDLGLGYLNGTGIAKDEKEAVKWLRDAANLGNPDAMYHMGFCSFHGAGMAASKKDCVEWFRKAAAADGLDGMLQLAALMIEGDEFVTRSPLEALTLLNKAQALVGNKDDSQYQIREKVINATLRVAQDDLSARRYSDARDLLTAARTASELLNKERPGRFYFMQELRNIWFELGNLERTEGHAALAADYYRRSMAVDGPEMTKATVALAELLEKGEGVAIDLAKASELRALIAKQKMKRFTVQCKMGDNGISFPVDVYVFEVFPWRHPLETQFCYFREERGFDLPKDTMDSFGRLYRIAKENNVSYTDLCEYAMGNKKDEKK